MCDRLWFLVLVLLDAGWVMRRDVCTHRTVWCTCPDKAVTRVD